MTAIVLKQYDEVKLEKHFNKDAHDENYETKRPKPMNMKCVWGCSLALRLWKVAKLVCKGTLLVLVCLVGTYTFVRGNWYEITSDVEGYQFLNSQNVSARMNMVATVIDV